MSANSSKLKLIIDTDPGVDDCHAIMMALSSKNIELIGLSCVSGNTSLENGLKNLHFLLQTFERREIPIFRGAERALDGRQKYAPHIHGENGFGGAMSTKQMQLDLIQEEPASVALVRLAKEYRGELIIAAIGPLTNLAIAQRLDPNFSRNLKQLHIMGGNCTIPRFQTLSSKFSRSFFDFKFLLNLVQLFFILSKTQLISANRTFDK